MSNLSKPYIIDYFESIGFKRNFISKDYIELYLNNKDKVKILVITINDKEIYMSLKTSVTSDYIFSNRFEYNIPKEELDVLLLNFKNFSTYFYNLF